jgi:hypothetical protein
VTQHVGGEAVQHRGEVGELPRRPVVHGPGEQVVVPAVGLVERGPAACRESEKAGAAVGRVGEPPDQLEPDQGGHRAADRRRVERVVGGQVLAVAAGPVVLGSVRGADRVDGGEDADHAGRDGGGWCLLFEQANRFEHVA